jgi:hypothetical protein
MATMQAAGRVEALIERPEDHREHSAEGAMETAICSKPTYMS